MELSKPFLEPLFILSEGEVYFLKTIVPILLILPWAIALFIILLRVILRWLASLKPKDKPLTNPIEQVIAFPTVPEDRAPKLKDITALAQTNPRLAIIELSKFVRIVNIAGGYEKLSLEFYLKETHKKKLTPWMNVFSDKFKSSLKAPNDLYADMALASYQLEEPTTEMALDYIAKVRGFKTKAKGKKDGI
jgi:hypothetical protein